MTTENERADYIAGLRALADLLEAHHELPLVHLQGMDINPLSFCAGFVNTHQELSEADIKQRIIDWSRLLMVGDRKKSEGTTIGGMDSLSLTGKTAAGLSVTVYGQREAICVRRVVGTETVEVPDPAAPRITETREVVEWDCAPLLAAREPVELERFDMSGSTPGADR